MTVLEYGTDHPPAPDVDQDGVIPTGLLADLRSGTWLDSQTFGPLQYVVPGVIPEGMTLLVGPPKIGKSWFVLGMALATAAGGRALGRIPVAQRPTLYLALEDGHRRLQSRCRTLLGSERIPTGLDYLITVRPGRVVDTIGEWLNQHGDAAPLVVLDTLGKVMPPAVPGESAYSRDYRIGSTLKALADRYPGTALVINHHDRKACSEDFVDSVSGTHGLAGAADTIVVLARRRHESTGTLTVTGRDVAEGEYALTAADGAWSIDGPDLITAAQKAEQSRARARVGDRMREVLQVLAELDRPCSAQDVADKVADLGVADAGRYLRRAVAAGRAHKAGRGLFTTTPKPLSEVSECPNGQVIHLPGSDTARRVSEPRQRP